MPFWERFPGKDKKIIKLQLVHKTGWIIEEAMIRSKHTLMCFFKRYCLQSKCDPAETVASSGFSSSFISRSTDWSENRVLNIEISTQKIQYLYFTNSAYLSKIIISWIFVLFTKLCQCHGFYFKNGALIWNLYTLGTNPGFVAVNSNGASGYATSLPLMGRFSNEELSKDNIHTEYVRKPLMDSSEQRLVRLVFQKFHFYWNSSTFHSISVESSYNWRWVWLQ